MNIYAEKLHNYAPIVPPYFRPTFAPKNGDFERFLAILGDFRGVKWNEKQGDNVPKKGHKNRG